MTDREKLVEKINAAFQRASPGTWIRREPPPGYDSVAIIQAHRARPTHGYDIEVLAEDDTLYPTRDGDLDFIVAVKNAWPELHAALLSQPAQPPDRDERQKLVIDWGTRAFGAEHMADKIVRAARFFEEATELVQAIGLPADHATRAFNHVYGRAPGNVEQEVGGVGVTLMALCGTVGMSAETCEVNEVNRCLSKPLDQFAARNRDKILAVDAPAQPSAQVPEEANDAMLEAGGARVREWLELWPIETLRCNSHTLALAVYEAMLAASPSPPQEAGE